MRDYALKTNDESEEAADSDINEIPEYDSSSDQEQVD